MLSYFIENSHLIPTIQKHLKTLNDSERSFQRLLLKRGSPQDMGTIRDMFNTCLQLVNQIRDPLNHSGNKDLQQVVILCDSIKTSAVHSLLNNALNEVPLFSIFFTIASPFISYEWGFH